MRSLAVNYDMLCVDLQEQLRRVRWRHVGMRFKKHNDDASNIRTLDFSEGEREALALLYP